ncbi:MAG: osmotically inducible protein C [Desulfuromonas sp.]|nr:MAG: osmotically inducible protein C [Desulfuromonas sp.]
MRTEKITFTNSDNQDLSGRLELPVDRKPHAYAIFAHCFTCSKNIKAAVQISRALACQGIAVLRFDFTGIGASEGEFAETSFSSNVDDLVRAAEFMRREEMPPALLIGHSLGGAAVINAAGKIDSIRAIITIAAPSDPAHIIDHFKENEEEILQRGEAEVDLGGRTFRIRKEFIDDLRESHLEEALQNLKKPLLVMHSPFDKIVSIDHAATIFKAARHPKSFISLDTADHLLSNAQDADYAGLIAATWAGKFLEIRRKDPDVTHPDNKVVARLEQGFHTDIVANGHPLVADEPIAVGGTNHGPSPYDLLVAGVGACTAMTLRMYADHKKLPLDAVTVTLTHKKIHAKDCDDCSSETGKIDHIEREISLTGELDAEQQQRMLEIADRCPVHKTLHSEVKITSRLVEEE